MNPTSTLDALLTGLRDAGLRIGVTEVARLHNVFRLQPEIADRAHLKSVLRAVVVKSAEDRRTFDRVCDAWISDADPELHRRPLQSSTQAPRSQSRRPPRRSRLWVAASIIAVLVAVVVLWVPEPDSEDSEPGPTPTPPPPVVATSTGPLELPTPEEVRQQTFTSWVPTLEVTTGQPRWNGWLPLGLGLLALMASSGLWRSLGNRHWLPEPAPPPTRKGPPRAYLTAAEPRGLQLLQPHEQEALVWGIGRFISDEPTPRLDLPATVRATAKNGGMPHLVYQLATYHREVWLWIDTTADDPALPRLADEIEHTLTTHGLPVERAHFRGVPERLVTPAGQAFTPNEIDEHRDVAMVAILTDGRVLARQRKADDRRVRIDALLRSLSHWPRLAFADFSGEGVELAAMVEGHDPAVVAPEHLASFLGAASTVEARARPVALPPVRADALWASACALAPASVAEATAFELREHLGLATSSWAMRGLRAEAPGPPGRLQWQDEDRARRVNWLCQAETTEGEDCRQSHHARALEFWEEHYDRELHLDDEAGIYELPGRQHLAMERAVLRLWKTKPGPVIHELYGWFQTPLGDAVRGHLGALTSDDALADRGRIRLPWAWEDRTALERVMLEEMGFGGARPSGSLRRPGRLLLAISLCVGLAATSLIMAGRTSKPPTGQPTVVHQNKQPPEAEIKLSPATGATDSSTVTEWLVGIRTRKWFVSEHVPPGARILIHWTLEDRPCIEQVEDGVEIWRCGPRPVPPPLHEGVKVSLVHLAAELHNAGAERLAIALLWSGSADIVIVDGMMPRRSLSDVMVPDQFLGVSLKSQPFDQVPGWINVFPSRGAAAWAQSEDWLYFVKGLEFTGTKPFGEAWDSADLISNRTANRIYLRGLGTSKSNMEFVAIPAGSFTMGSPENETGRYSWEGPTHQVTLSAFEMNRTEVTNAQYRQLHPKHLGGDLLPAVEVSWHEARAFCENFGFRLPTEAEWGYAARAGTQTRWSFGDDESRLGDYAWYRDNSDNQPHEVGTKQPNDFGLYDMHGNAWEWVEDRWSNRYPSEAQIDPTGPEGDDDRRVLRGGAFWSGPTNLRSANRLRIVPENRLNGVGFRCVRSPRRQP